MIRPALTVLMAALALAAPALADTSPPKRVSFPPQVMPYVYRVLSYGADRYAVQVKSGFVGPAEAARAIQPLCAARAKAVAGVTPATVVIGGAGGSAMAALSYSVRCR
ncbi:hypothetical protein [Frigidibacter mobilis]|uniref:UrcA family protein n=1 Tax=Frigidibacter mobilis TaxID=1335048 RepID=A0A161HBX3_9RHOB|nr:hypothetical protein [Frigidibacter mobilis]AMY68699.1 hypothetical protein AKL17_1446 [Frigidibacter mobilis]